MGVTRGGLGLCVAEDFVHHRQALAPHHRLRGERMPEVMNAQILEPAELMREPASSIAPPIRTEQPFAWRRHPLRREAIRDRAGDSTRRFRHAGSAKRITFYPASDTLEPARTLHLALKTLVHPFPNDTASELRNSP